MDDYVFDKSIFYFILRFDCYTSFTIKNEIFTTILKILKTDVNVTVTNIKNRIIKQ